MTWGEYKPAFESDGFVIVRRFLPPDELSELIANLDRYISEVVPTLPDSAAFYHDPTRPETLKQMNNMGGDEYFESYRRHPAWNALAETLVGEPVEARKPEWFNKPSGIEHPTPPHQDNYYFCLKPANVATLWLALDPVDEQNGCLRYVSGSHRGGVQDHNPSKVLGFSQGIENDRPEDQSREVPICLEPGDLVAHHGETIHRADTNRSANRQRRAFAMVFAGRSCRLDEVALERYQTALKRQHETMGLQT